MESSTSHKMLASARDDPPSPPLPFRGAGETQLQVHGWRTFRYGQGWAPLVSQDVQADAAVGVDVRKVNACGKIDIGRLERVVCREVENKEKHTARVWRDTLQHRVSRTILPTITV